MALLRHCLAEVRCMRGEWDASDAEFIESCIDTSPRDVGEHGAEPQLQAPFIHDEFRPRDEWA